MKGDRDTPRYTVVSNEQSIDAQFDVMEHHAIYDEKLETKLAGTSNLSYARIIANSLNTYHGYPLPEYPQEDQII